MKKLIDLSIHSDQHLCCEEKMIGTSGKKTETRLQGRATFIDEGASNTDYMSYKGRVEVQLNEEEMIEIAKVSKKALERLSGEVKKSGTDKG